MAAGDATLDPQSCRTLGKAAIGEGRVTSTVRSSRALYSNGARVPAHDDANSGCCKRSQLKMTASASYGVPSVNFTPSRILKVHTVASSLDVKDSAILGSVSPVA